MCAGEKKNQFYSFWVGVHVTVGKELMKDDRKTPNIRFVGKPGVIDGFWSVPAEHEDVFFSHSQTTIYRNTLNETFSISIFSNLGLNKEEMLRLNIFNDICCNRP